MAIGLRWGWLAGLAIAAAMSSTASAQDKLRAEVAELAKSVSQAVADLGEDSVAVGQFSGPAQFPSTGGPAIANALTQELGKLGVAVKKRARLGVKGEFRNVKDEESGRLAARIEAVLSESDGKQRLQLARLVFGPEALTALFGLTTDLSTQQDPVALDNQLQASIKDPKIHIASGRIATTPASPYALEVLIKTPDGYTVRPAIDQEGLAFVKIARGEVYAVRLVNNSKHDAAVDLKIDGLSMYTFSENKNYRVLFVPAGQSYDVVGWHRTNKLSDAFQVTEYAKSEAARQLAPSSTDGTITATFAAAWPEGAKRPDDEPSGTSRSVDGTGRGEQVPTDLREVRREVGVVRAAISVRYSESVDPKDLPGGKVADFK